MASGHSHKSLTIFLFYLPVSRLLEAAANRENSSSRNTQKEITTHELQKRPMFDHCVSVTQSRFQHVGLANAKVHHRVWVKCYLDLESTFQLIQLPVNFCEPRASTGKKYVPNMPKNHRSEPQCCIHDIRAWMFIYFIEDHPFILPDIRTDHFTKRFLNR